MRSMRKKRVRAAESRQQEEEEEEDSHRPTVLNGTSNNEASRFSPVVGHGNGDSHFPTPGHLSSLHPSSDLAGRDRSHGPGPEGDRPSSSANNSEVMEEGEGEDDERFQTLLDPERCYFSLALKECQNRQCRSEERPPSEHRRRPVSFDFSSRASADVSISSPLSHIAGASVKKRSGISNCSKSCTFPSPGAPIYRHNPAVGYTRGCSSERMPLPAHIQGRRAMGGTSLFVPFGGGRGLPSKWEDAEKWILSPASGDGIGVVKKNKVVQSNRRRPKSKSGPLGSTPAVGSRAVALPLIGGGSMASSPLTTGVLLADHAHCGHGGMKRGGSGSGWVCSASQSEHAMVRSASMHGWSELMDSSSLPGSQDDNSDSTKEAFPILPPVSTKDVGTQMSPDCCSARSSPREKPVPGPSSPPAPSSTASEPRSGSSESEVRDVQVDGSVRITEWTKGQVTGGSDRDPTSITRWKKKSVDSRTSVQWKYNGTVKCVARLDRAEAKITAWENLQRAKAEAAIQKLETKLEKKRASSMDKILRKLRAAQRVAEEMRDMVAAVPGDGDVTVKKGAALSRRTGGRLSLLTGCLTWHP